jgi:quercetin dioxygenase-like cupin family protein
MRASAAGVRDGTARAFEVWLLTLEPGACGSVRTHDGELLVLALAGCGKLIVDGGPQRFIAPCSLLIPPHLAYQVVNNGAVALQLVEVFTAHAGRARG